MSRAPGETQTGGAMRAFAAAAAAAALAVTMVWSTGAEAAEARIADFEFECTTPEGQTLKPKFGDVGGVFYTDLPGQREQCLQAIERKIALCRENVDFESNTKNEKHAGCLPIFAQQAESCVGHFEFERGKCGAGGPGPDETGQQDEAAPADAYTVEPLDTVMEVTKRANVRSGPGTDHAVIGTLDAGVGVRVTGQVEGGAWLRVDLREDGGAAFIHASLLTEMAPEAPEAPLEPFGPEWSIVTNQPCQVWRGWLNAEATATVDWSGGCVDGKASGPGEWGMTVAYQGKSYSFAYEGAMRDGRRHGRGTMNWPDDAWWITRYEGEWHDDQMHGRGTLFGPGDLRYEGEMRDGRKHGQGVRWEPGIEFREEGEFRDGFLWNGVSVSPTVGAGTFRHEYRGGQIVDTEWLHD